MNGLYKPVRIVLVIVLAVLLVLSIIKLVKTIDAMPSKPSGNDIGMIVTMVIQVLAIGCGFMGAYYEDRRRLIMFAVVATVVWIAGIILDQRGWIIANTTVSVIAVLLALFQANMLRSLTSPLF